MLTDIRALADQFLIAFPNINTYHPVKRTVNVIADFVGSTSSMIIYFKDSCIQTIEVIYVESDVTFWVTHRW